MEVEYETLMGAGEWRDIKQRVNSLPDWWPKLPSFKWHNAADDDDDDGDDDDGDGDDDDDDDHKSDNVVDMKQVVNSPFDWCPLPSETPNGTITMKHKTKPLSKKCLTSMAWQMVNRNYRWDDNGHKCDISTSLPRIQQSDTPHPPLQVVLPHPPM